MRSASYTGDRIRERRLGRGIRQSDLSRRVGISASYLNLIEHNRRKIGGKLLLALADALGVPASALAEGADEELLDALREAAEPGRSDAPVEEPASLVARFPGWARIAAAQHRRIAALERTVEGLSDRLAHDPVLADNLHDILSAVTSVRSTASILNQTPDIDPQWRARFHANLHQDSTRLAETAQSLVSYFDALAKEDTSFSAPMERVEAYLAARDHHLPELESGGLEFGRENTGQSQSVPAGTDRVPGRAGADVSDPDGGQSGDDVPDTVSDTVPDTAPNTAPNTGPDTPPADSLATRIAKGGGPEDLSVARRVLARYAADARAVTPDRLLAALNRHGLEPASIAHDLGVPISQVLRRLATMPPGGPLPQVGLVLCDGAGALIFRRRLDGFPVPQFGAACPLWPLYQVLSRPHVPLRQMLETPAGQRVLSFAVAEPVGPARFDTPPVIEATMLVLPADVAAGQADQPQTAPPPAGSADVLSAMPVLSALPVLGVGSACRVCPRPRCPARREGMAGAR